MKSWKERGRKGRKALEEVRKEGVRREIKEKQRTYVINSVQLCISETIVRSERVFEFCIIFYTISCYFVVITNLYK